MSVWITPIPLFLLGSILISGLVGAARITLKAHTISQVFAGFLLGFFCESFFVFLLS
jgi:membrane-associated phospholipid phosphatase